MFFFYSRRLKISIEIYFYQIPGGNNTAKKFPHKKVVSEIRWTRKKFVRSNPPLSRGRCLAHHLVGVGAMNLSSSGNTRPPIVLSRWQSLLRR